MENIIELHKRDVKNASIILGRAFQHDPLMCYLFPDSVHRMNRNRYLFEYLLKLGINHGHCYVTSENMEGLIMLFPSTSPYDKLGSQISSGILKGIMRIGLGTALRALKYDDFSTIEHKKNITGEHLYLHTLGVDPDYQGNGHSSTLMKYLDTNLNPRNLPIYLETSNPENVAIYEHFGFKLQKESIVPGSGDKVKMWAMLKG